MIETYRILDYQLIPELVASLKEEGVYGSHGEPEENEEADSCDRVIRLAPGERLGPSLRDWAQGVVNAYNATCHQAVTYTLWCEEYPGHMIISILDD